MFDKFDNIKVDILVVDLCFLLNSLVVEYFVLVIMGMEKGFNGLKDYDYVSWLENVNIVDFKVVIGLVYGDEGVV